MPDADARELVRIKAAVDRALEYLATNQKPDGSSPQAVDVIVAAQNKEGGWRYQPQATSACSCSATTMIPTSSWRLNRCRPTTTSHRWMPTSTL